MNVVHPGTSGSSTQAIMVLYCWRDVTMPNGEPTADAPPFRILSLDGGGAKGFYTLGVLPDWHRVSGLTVLNRCVDGSEADG